MELAGELEEERKTNKKLRKDLENFSAREEENYNLMLKVRERLFKLTAKNSTLDRKLTVKQGEVDYYLNQCRELCLKLNEVENKSNNYLTELNELDNDFQEQENLLADKNAKLSQNITEKNDLNTELTENQQDYQELEEINETKNQRIIELTNQLTNERNLNQTLQDQIDNHACPTLAPHTCPPCPLIHLPAPHVCPIVNNVNCSHSDYEEIKEQRDNYQSQLETALNEKSAIISKINQECNLDLNNPSLEQVITRIKELISKPPTFTGNDENLKKELEQAQQTITRLEKQLQEPTPFGEDLETIKEIDINSLEKELDIKFSVEAMEKIQQAINYQQYSFLRNSEIKKYLQQRASDNLAVIKPSKEIQLPKERIIWISLLIISWLTIGGLLVKIAKKGKRKS